MDRLLGISRSIFGVSRIIAYAILSNFGACIACFNPFSIVFEFFYHYIFFLYIVKPKINNTRGEDAFTWGVLNENRLDVKGQA